MSEESPLVTTLKVPGAAAPWIVIRSQDSVQLQNQLAELMSNTTFADIGRAQAALEAQFNAGAKLDARGVTAPVNTGAFNQPQQPVQAAPAPQYGPPAQQYGPPAPQYPQQPQQQYPQAPQQYQQPAPAYGGGQGSAPGAPLVNGEPAKLVKGNKNGRDWQAWADPRPREVTQGMERTDDPNHPGIANGTHSLFKFIR